MAYHLIIVLALFMVCSSEPIQANQDQSQSISNFVAASVIQDIKISPDGRHLALLTPLEGRNVLTIVKTASLEPVNVLRFGSTKQVGEFYWANNDRVILRLDYFVSWYAAPTSAGEWYAVNLDGKKQENIFGFRSSKGASSKIKTHAAGDFRSYGTLVDILKDDKRNILMSATPFSRTGDKQGKLFKVNIYNGRSKLIDTSPVENATYGTDLKGNVRFVVGETKALQKQIYYRDTEKDPWALLSSGSYNEGTIQPLAFADNDSIYVADNTNTDLFGIYRLDLKTKEKELIYEDLESDPTNFWYSEKTGDLYSIEYETTTTKYVHLSGDSQNVKSLQMLLSAFPNHQARIISQTRTEELSVIAVFSDKNPGDFYLFDAKANSLRFLASAKPKIKPESMLATRPVELKSRDGLPLRGYLTMPENSGGLPPLIVNPHGGPIGVRDRWQFNGEAQLFASQGYAVLQVNFRGSGGFGRRFQEMGLKNWGSKIQHDIIDATQWAIENGHADPERICIYGASFGGYSALMAPIVAPDLFACAAGFVGVYDLEYLYKGGDIPDRKSGIAFLEKAIGRDSEVLRSFSPSYRANELNLPIMILHGEEDPRAPVEHAYAMMNALDQAKKPYEKLIFKKEGHGLFDTEAKNALYESLLNFFAQSLQPVAKP